MYLYLLETIGEVSKIYFFFYFSLICEIDVSGKKKKNFLKEVSEIYPLFYFLTNIRIKILLMPPKKREGKKRNFLSVFFFPERTNPLFLVFLNYNGRTRQVQSRQKS